MKLTKEEIAELTVAIEQLLPGFSGVLALFDEPEPFLRTVVVKLYTRATGIPGDGLTVTYGYKLIRVVGRIDPLPTTDFYLIGDTRIHSGIFVDSFTVDKLFDAIQAMATLSKSLKRAGSDSPLTAFAE